MTPYNVALLGQDTQLPVRVLSGASSVVPYCATLGPAAAGSFGRPASRADSSGTAAGTPRQLHLPPWSEPASLRRPVGPPSPAAPGQSCAPFCGILHAPDEPSVSTRQASLLNLPCTSASGTFLDISPTAAPSAAAQPRTCPFASSSRTSTREASRCGTRSVPGAAHYGRAIPPGPSPHATTHSPPSTKTASSNAPPPPSVFAQGARDRKAKQKRKTRQQPASEGMAVAGSEQQQAHL